MGGRMFRVVLTLVTGPIMRARAIAIILCTMAGSSSVMPGITGRSATATTVAAANIGIAAAGGAAPCMRAQDYAEILRADLADGVATTATMVQDGDGGGAATKPRRP